MRLTEITDIESPELRVYSGLTERQLRGSEEDGLFIAESPKVIKVALDAGYIPDSLLCEKKHIEGDAAEIIARCGETTPLYTASREILANLTGYKLTRGVLCAMRRKPNPRPEEIVRGKRRIAVLESVCDSTNIGAIFRSAAALGTDGIILTPDCCDPLNRRCVRVSMGSVFLIPWCLCGNPVEILRKEGFTTAALALTDNSVSIDYPPLKECRRLAMVLGTEGDGLRRETIAACDYTVKIPMSHNVDSLNVAAASAVAFWELRAQ